ncbi:MAG TPA: lipopolysaccharide kinase InaA family protein, partial [Pseudomonadales bacterium]
MSALTERICSADVRLDAQSLDALCQAGDVLERVNRSGQPKVLRIESAPGAALIVKIWYPKGGLSSESLVPYAARFRRNAKRLRRRSVTAPDVLGWGTLEGTRIRFVCYREIPGRSLRDRIPDVDLAAVGAYVAELHDSGIDFRSLHMGNILWTGRAQFGLIDVTDCYFPRFMSRRKRLRRLQFFCSHRPERSYLLTNGHWAQVVSAYCAAAGTDPTW